MRDLEDLQVDANAYGSSSQAVDMDATPKEMSVYFVVFFLLLGLSIILSVSAVTSIRHPPSVD